MVLELLYIISQSINIICKTQVCDLPSSGASDINFSKKILKKVGDCIKPSLCSNFQFVFRTIHQSM